MIYETLFFYGTAKAGVVDRWLGTSYAWSNGGKTLTVQLRHGVKWTDGKPFTSADVAYTFNLALKNAALNKFALPLKSVTTSGLYIVALNFKQSAYTDAYYALGRVDILPQHIWQSVKNPTTFLRCPARAGPLLHQGISVTTSHRRRRSRTDAGPARPPRRGTVRLGR
jgi:peptide/nickel transport system substrate-binding protein